MNWLVILFLGGVLALAWWAFRSEGISIPSPKRTMQVAKERAERKGVKPAPLIGTCAVCGKKVTMPFRCKFCGQLFCSKHRLPEDHNCDGMA